MIASSLFLPKHRLCAHLNSKRWHSVNMACAEDWKHYRVLRWQAFLGWLFGAYMGRFASDLSRLYYALFHTSMNLKVYWGLTAICVAAGFSILLYTWIRWGWWACPRCGGPFFGTTPFFGKACGANPFRRTCSNCGLRKWACN